MKYLAVALLLSATDAYAGQATCSSPGLPIGAAASSDLISHRVVVGITSGILPLSGTEILNEPTGPQMYDADLTFIENRFNAEYTLSPTLAIAFSLPHRIIDVAVNRASIHARSERLMGFGDAVLRAHLAREFGGFRFHVRAGTSLPIGETLDENPFLLGNIGQDHQHIQFGAGTFIPTIALEVQRTLIDRWLTATAWGQAAYSFYDNSVGYRQGSRFGTGANLSSPLGTQAWSFALAAELYAETAETWNGMVYLDEGNSGRRDLFVGGSLAYRPLDNLALGLDVRMPIYSKVTGNQLGYDGFVGLAVTSTFDLAGPRATYHGVDHEVAGPAGTVAPLTPVPNKIAIYDLWATWCPPCRELDDKLEALARKYPDRVAIRKLDVVDTDSAAWAQYLAPKGFELPHIKLVRPDGAVVLEQSAKPDELITAIEDYLAK